MYIYSVEPILELYIYISQYIQYKADRNNNNSNNNSDDDEDNDNMMTTMMMIITTTNTYKNLIKPSKIKHARRGATERHS